MSPASDNADQLLQILAKLLLQTARYLDLSLDSVLAWSERTSPGKRKTYVANRVQKTIDKVFFTNWRYVHPSQNPADLISRDVAPGELLQSELWCKGPSWLSRQPVKVQVAFYVLLWQQLLLAWD